MREPPADTESQVEYVLDGPRRLSQSMLWQLQRRFFERKGHAAWGDQIVPSYITTNPFIAGAYAQVILGWLLDCASPSAPLGTLDRRQPVYIVELGAGAGRLAFNILKSLGDWLSLAPLRDLRIRYVLTDLAQKNIDFWASHPALQTWIDAGLVDFALFDAEHPGPLELWHSDVVLAPGSVANPVAVVANYFFDSIPQDAFYVEKGQLSESLLKLTYPAAKPDLDDPELFRKVNLVYHRQPARSDYYSDPDFNAILDSYRRGLDATAVDFPVFALETLRFLRELGRGRLLLVTGDKGYDRPEDLRGRQEPGYAVHGSFSMMVNYDAIARYLTLHKGEVLRTSYHYSGLNILAVLAGASAGHCSETRLAFHRAIEQRGPDDFFMMSQALEPNLKTWKTEEILAYLRFTGWDSHIFYKCFPILLDQLAEASERVQAEARMAIEQLWEHYYYIEEEEDLPFDLGLLLFKLGDYGRALEFLDISLQLYGPAASTYYNRAVCLYRCDRNQEALAAVKQALALKPDMESAKKLEAAIEKVTGYQ